MKKINSFALFFSSFSKMDFVFRLMKWIKKLLSNLIFLLNKFVLRINFFFFFRFLEKYKMLIIYIQISLVKFVHMK